MSNHRRHLIREKVAANGLELWRTDPAVTPLSAEQAQDYWCEVRCPTCKLLLVGGPCNTVGALWAMWEAEKVRHVTRHPKGL